MSVPSKLQKWLEAGLITPEQKARILDHEKAHSGNRWRNGVANAGLLSILLGIALIIASNWQVIPWQAKIGIHFTINAVLTALVWRWWHDTARDTHREIALGALWGLTLTFIALMGQIFQMGGTAADAIRIWFWLTTPMILLFAQSRSLARIWAIAFVFYVPFDIMNWAVHHVHDDKAVQCIALATAILIPLGAWAIGAIPRVAVNRPTIGRMLRRLGVLLALVTAAVAGLAYYQKHIFVNIGFAAAMAVVAIGAHFILRKLHPSADDRPDIDIICIASVFTCVPFIVPVQSDIAAIAHFILLCLIAGAIYQQQGKSRQVSMAISFVTLRLCVAFVEVFGSLMTSGFGFIISGVLLLALVKAAKHLDTRLKARAQ